MVACEVFGANQQLLCVSVGDLIDPVDEHQRLCPKLDEPELGFVSRRNTEPLEEQVGSPSVVVRGSPLVGKLTPPATKIDICREQSRVMGAMPHPSHEAGLASPT